MFRNLDSSWQIITIWLFYKLPLLSHISKAAHCRSIPAIKWTTSVNLVRCCPANQKWRVSKPHGLAFQGEDQSAVAVDREIPEFEYVLRMSHHSRKYPPFGSFQLSFRRCSWQYSPLTRMIAVFSLLSRMRQESAGGIFPWGTERRDGSILNRCHRVPFMRT